jgi:hypothetical protein
VQIGSRHAPARKKLPERDRSKYSRIRFCLTFLVAAASGAPREFVLRELLRLKELTLPPLIQSIFAFRLISDTI